MGRLHGQALHGRRCSARARWHSSRPSPIPTGDMRYCCWLPAAWRWRYCYAAGKCARHRRTESIRLMNLKTLAGFAAGFAARCFIAAGSTSGRPRRGQTPGPGCDGRSVYRAQGRRRSTQADLYAPRARQARPRFEAVSNPDRCRAGRVERCVRRRVHTPAPW